MKIVINNIRILTNEELSVLERIMDKQEKTLEYENYSKYMKEEHVRTKKIIVVQQELNNIEE